MTGFHANYRDLCEKFIEDESYMINSGDTKYLGSGMYFWEHKSNALYWKKSKKHGRDSCIVSADIDLENMLDLTDDDVCNWCNKIFSLFSKKIACMERIELGKRLDYLFDAFKLPHTVVKGREHKTNKRENIFLYQTNMTTQSMDIYCVKTIGAIVANTRKWVQP